MSNTTIPEICPRCEAHQMKAYVDGGGYIADVCPGCRASWYNDPPLPIPEGLKAEHMIGTEEYDRLTTEDAPGVAGAGQMTNEKAVA